MISFILSEISILQKIFSSTTFVWNAFPKTERYKKEIFLRNIKYISEIMSCYTWFKRFVLGLYLLFETIFLQSYN